MGFIGLAKFNNKVINQFRIYKEKIEKVFSYMQKTYYLLVFRTFF